MPISNLSNGLRTGVCTSTNRPTTPYEGQHIYETDTDLVYLWNGTAWVEIVSALTKAPRGVMGVHTLTGIFTTSATHTTFQDDGLTLTITEISGRRYRITVIEQPYPSGGQQGTQFKLVRNATDLRSFTYSTAVMDSGVSYPAVMQFVYTSAASGSTTYKVQLAALSANTAVSTYGDALNPRQLLIEDIGVS